MIWIRVVWAMFVGMAWVLVGAAVVSAMIVIGCVQLIGWVLKLGRDQVDSAA